MNKFQLNTIRRNFGWLLLACLFGFGMQEAKAQFTGCTGTPTFTYNFVGNPGGSFVSSNVSRAGNCCSDNNCVHFILILDTNTAAVNMQIVSGALPSGSLFYELDCGGQTNINSSICVTNQTGAIDTHHLTFCKPGNNPNEYRVNSVARPTFNDATVLIGCSDTMKVLGLQPTGATWNSISPGTPGQYNNLLSCTNCPQPVFTPNNSTPDSVKYLVCGFAQANQCVGNQQFCDTVTVRVPGSFSNAPDQSVCAPATTVNLGNALPGSSWSVVSGNPAAATIGAGTGAVSGMTVNGTYRFVLISTNGKCRDTVAVIRTAKPNAGTDQSICLPQTTTSLGAAPGGQSWSVQSGNPAAASVGASSGAVTGMTVPGTYNFILSGGGCSDTVAVLIKAQPNTPTANNNGPLCDGQTLNLTASNVTNATYSWTGPGGFASNTQNPSIVNATTANSGIYKVVATVNGCPSDTGTTNAVINAIPAQLTASSNSPVCEGDTIRLFANGGQGGATYAWTGPNTYTSGQQNPIRLNASLSMNGNYCVTQTVSGCTSPQHCTIVTVNVRPVISGTSSSNPSTCGGTNGSITLNGLVAGQTYTVNYDKNSVPQGPINLIANGGGQVIISGLGAGTYTFISVTTLLGCSSSSVPGPIVLSDPITPANLNLGSNSPRCVGQTLNLTAGGGQLGSSYSWTGPDNFSSINQNPIIPNTTTDMTGTYCATQTLNGCTSAPSCINVTINPNPSASAGPDHTICDGKTATLGGAPTATGGTPNYTFDWNNGAQDISNPVVSPSNTTIYVVTVTDSRGCTATDGVTVNVNPTPTADAGDDQNYIACDTLGIQIGDAPTASGGTQPYTYNWSPPSGLNSTSISNPILKGIGSSTNYSVTVTDNNGCSATDAVFITVLGNAVSTTISNTGSLSWCSGTGGSVILTAVPSGGLTPYQYSWTGSNLSSNSTVSTTASPNTPGVYNYSLVVTDSVGCQAGSFISVTVFESPTADAGDDINLPSCSPTGLTIGGDPTAIGGVGPYTYSWSPVTGLTFSFSENPNIVLNTVGSPVYTVVVTDQNNCTASDQVTVNVVNNSPIPNITANGPTEWCFGSGGSVNLTANITNGSAQFSYAWSGSSINPTNTQIVTVNPTTVGPHIYSVVVTDALNCTAQTSTTITVNDNPVVDAGPNISICNGVSDTIGGNPTASGGSGGGYNYSWSNGAAPEANPIVSPLSTTTYVVTVTDGNNCSSTAAATVFVNSNPNADAGPDRSLVGCAGNSVQIGGSPTANGGSGNYSYIWAPDNGLDDETAAHPTVTGVLSNTIYCVTVTDLNGCTSSDCMELTVFPSTLQAVAAADIEICSNAPTGVNIGGTPSVFGGTPPYSFTWSPVNGLTGDTNPNPFALPSVTTTYCLTVTDNNGCTATDCVQVTVNEAPLADAGADQEFCAGICTTIGGVNSGSGGTGPLTYSWSPSNWLNAIGVPNPQACPASTVGYTLVVTDTKGCSATDNVTLNVNPNPTANAGLDRIYTTCSTNTLTLGASPTASNGTPGYTYEWSPSDALNNTTVSNPQLNGLTANTLYGLTVTDSKGCTATDQVEVFIESSNLTAEAGNGGSICSNENASILLGGNPTVIGGFPIYTYNWSPTSGLNSSIVANPLAKPLTTTTYYLTVTDEIGCTATDSVVVIINPAPVANTGPDVETCLSSGTITPVQIGLPATGGTPGYTYQWSPGALSCLTCVSPMAAPPVTTSYCETVTDAVGCSASACVTVSVNPGGNANAGPDKQITNCPGSFAVLGGTPTASGGSGSFTYAWSPDSVGGVKVLNNPSSDAPIVTGLTQTTIFCVTVTDNVSGCQSVDCIRVEVLPSTLTANAGVDKGLCANGSACVNIGGVLTAIGGVPPYSYQWFGSNLDFYNVSNPCASPTASETYYLTVTDFLGCQSFDTVTVNIGPAITVNAGTDTAVCSGSSVRLGGSTVATGGTGAFTYQWSPSIFIGNPNAANPLAQNITSDICYIVTVTDQIGCSAFDDICISARPLPIANAGPDVALYPCVLDSAILGGTPTATGTVAPYRYSWFPNFDLALSDTNAANPVLKNLGRTTQICVTVTDSFGCKATDCLTATTLPNTLIANARPNILPRQCTNTLTCLDLGANPPYSGGIPGYSFRWSVIGGADFSTAANPNVCPTATSSYLLIVTDSKGCQSSDTLRVEVNAPPVASISGLNARYCANAPNVVLTGVPAGGVFSGSCVSGNIFQPSCPGPGNFVDIRYTYTDPVTGCSDDTVFRVTIDSVPVVTITGGDKPGGFCKTEDPFNLIGTPPGGTFSGTGVSSSGLFTPANANVGNNTITYTFTSSAGCTSSAQIIIPVKATPTLTLSASADSVCEGQNLTITPNFSIEVTTILWFRDGQFFASDLNPKTIIAPTADFCIQAVASSSVALCPASDTLCFHVIEAPTANDDVANTCEDTCVTIAVLDNDDNFESTVATITVINSGNGTATVSGRTVNYCPRKDFNGRDTITYRVCTKDCNNACDTANVFIDVCPINDPPVAVDDIDTVCLSENTINVMANDSDVDGDQFQVVSIPCAPKFGTATINQNGTITYTQGTGSSTLIPDTFCYVICDNGNPVLCDTAQVTVGICRYVGAKNDTEYICKNDIINIPVIRNDTVAKGNTLVVTDVTDAVPSALGEIINVTDDIVTFMANDLTGTVRFRYTVCDNGTPAICDEGSVLIYIQDCPPPAIDTIIDTTYENTPITICLEGLVNSVKPYLITEICEPLHGTVEYSDTCFTYYPDSNFVGNDTFCLTICNVYGCTTVPVIISVLDTVRCFIPNAFSPNGDGVNDVYQIPCNDDYPEATLRIYNRWGLEVWNSEGPYRNNFDGHNMQGILLPDGTYYLIYEYNDGSGKRESKYVVIHR